MDNFPRNTLTTLYVAAGETMTLFELVEKVSIHFGWFDSLQEFDIYTRHLVKTHCGEIQLFYVITRARLPEPVYAFAAPTPKPLDMLANY